MPAYWTCPYCNANLDPGEKCGLCGESPKSRPQAAASPRQKPQPPKSSGGRMIYYGSNKCRIVYD